MQLINKYYNTDRRKGECRSEDMQGLYCWCEREVYERSW